MSFDVDKNGGLIGWQNNYFGAVTFVPLENGLLAIWHLICALD